MKGISVTVHSNLKSTSHRTDIVKKAHFVTGNHLPCNIFSMFKHMILHFILSCTQPNRPFLFAPNFMNLEYAFQAWSLILKFNIDHVKSGTIRYMYMST